MNRYDFRETVSFSFCLPYKLGSSLKEKNFLPSEYFFSFKGRFLEFRSFSKKYRVKNIRLAFFARDSLTMLRTPVSAIFVFAPKIDNAAIVTLHCILG